MRSAQAQIRSQQDLGFEGKTKRQTSAFACLPHCNASEADKVRAVNIKSFAFEGPKRRVVRCVPPAPGMIPRLVSGSPIFVTLWPSRED